MNCVMAIGTPVDQGQTRAVVVRRMTLQAERGLAHGKHVLVWRSMSGVTLEAALVYRRVLEGERPLIFGMAGETEFVSVGQLQIVARAAAVRVVTINAAHFGFANRVVVRQICFGILLLVAAQAVLILLAARIDSSRNTRGFSLELDTRLSVRLAMNSVAVAALDILCRVCAGKPVANMIGFRVAG